jgi:hypothetical protein
VKHPTDLMLGMSSALVLVGSVLNLAAMKGRPDGYESLTWRAKFIDANRRHPRLRGAVMACMTAALIINIGVVVTSFG